MLQSNSVGAQLRHVFGLDETTANKLSSALHATSPSDTRSLTNLVEHGTHLTSAGNEVKLKLTTLPNGSLQIITTDPGARLFAGGRIPPVLISEAGEAIRGIPGTASSVNELQRTFRINEAAAEKIHVALDEANKALEFGLGSGLEKVKKELNRAIHGVQSNRYFPLEAEYVLDSAGRPHWTIRETVKPRWSLRSPIVRPSGYLGEGWNLRSPFVKRDPKLRSWNKIQSRKLHSMPGVRTAPWALPGALGAWGVAGDYYHSLGVDIEREALQRRRGVVPGDTPTGGDRLRSIGREQDRIRQK
jgi:hypothetical protein